jgi:putative tryptophan/tyrosine transport system substrate-binding protein
MRRRELMLLGGALAGAWPLAGRTQQKAMPVIGYLNSASPGPAAPYVAAFRQGLSERGCVEGQNVSIGYRWAKEATTTIRSCSPAACRSSSASSPASLGRTAT